MAVILYLGILIVAVLIITPELYALRKLVKESRENKAKLGNRIETAFAKLKQNSKYNIPVEVLTKSNVFLFHQIWVIVKWISIIFHLPIMMTRLALIVRLGIKFSWQFPFSLYELWELSFLALSFYHAFHNSLFLSVTLAVLVLISSLYLIGSDLEEDAGKLKLLTIPIYKLRLSGVIQQGVTVILCFASLFYAIGKIDPKAFSVELTIIDSIYYSVVTVATVGFGDITPVSTIAKIVSVLEIFFGFVYIVFLISIFINVWSSRKIKDNASNEKELKKDNDNIDEVTPHNKSNAADTKSRAAD